MSTSASVSDYDLGVFARTLADRMDEGTKSFYQILRALAAGPGVRRPPQSSTDKKSSFPKLHGKERDLTE